MLEVSNRVLAVVQNGYTFHDLGTCVTKSPVRFPYKRLVMSVLGSRTDIASIPESYKPSLCTFSSIDKGLLRFGVVTFSSSH